MCVVYIHMRVTHVHIIVFIRRGATLSNRAGLFEMSMPDDDQHTLKLCKVKSSDLGPLSFTASNQYGTDSCILTLEQAGTPILLTYPNRAYLMPVRC